MGEVEYPVCYWAQLPNASFDWPVVPCLFCVAIGLTIRAIREPPTKTTRVKQSTRGATFHKVDLTETIYDLQVHFFGSHAYDWQEVSFPVGPGALVIVNKKLPVTTSPVSGSSSDPFRLCGIRYTASMIREATMANHLP